MARIAENTVIVDGQEYKPGDTIPDFKSIKCVDTREPRKYQGLSADVSVLNDVIAKYASGGASCFMSDTGEYYEYDRKEKAWKLITNITERGFDSEKAYGALKHMLKNVTVSDEKIQSAVTNYLTVNPVLPGATTEQAQQIEQNKTDVASLKTETSSLKEDIVHLNNSLVSGINEPKYYLSNIEFLAQLPSWVNYDPSVFNIDENKVEMSGHVDWCYKLNPFEYMVGDTFVFSLKLKTVRSNIAGGQKRFTIGLHGYTQTPNMYYIDLYSNRVNVYKDEVNSSNLVETHQIGETIDLKRIVTTEQVTGNKFIELKMSNSSLTDYGLDILNFSISNGLPEKKIVKYADESNRAKIADGLSDEAKKFFSGKTWGAIGDSLTTSWFDVYVSYVAKNTGLIATNYGKGGTCVANTPDADVKPSFVDRVCGLNGQTGYTDEFDLWTVFGGTNDIFKNVPIGTIDDNVDNTFYGALNKIVTYLLNKSNHPTVALITPYHLENANTKQYVDAILNIGEKYGIHVLNLYALSGINDVNRSYYLRDIAHPTQAGADKLRPIILKWFSDIRLPEETDKMPN